MAASPKSLTHGTRQKEEACRGETAKLNDVDPQAWLADVLRRISDHPAARLDDLLPWNWKSGSAKLAT
jgi:IS66 C-terminal element